MKKNNAMIKKSGSILSKALAVILSVYLVFGLVCISAFATEDEEVNDVRLNELAEQGGAEALPQVNESAVSFVTEYSTISINGQILQSPSATIKLTTGAGFSFQVIPDNNASIYEVKAINGSATTVLSSTDGSTYYVDGSLVDDFLTISAVSTPIQASQNEAVPIDEANEADVPQGEGTQDSSDDSENPGVTEDDATYYTVTFYYSDGVVFDKVQKIEEGQPASVPAATPPAEEGEHFDAWYVPGQLEPYDFNVPVLSNLDLYAAFLPDKIDEQGATADPEQNAEKGEDLSSSSVTPQVQDAFANLFAQMNAFEASVGDYRTVTLIVGSEEAEVPVRYNTLMARPDDPVDPLGEMPFHAWYQEGALQPFDFNTPIAEDITLKAVFSNQHIVKFLDYDGYDFALRAVDHGGYLKTEDLPKPDTPLGINFSYWSASPEGEAFNEAIFEDITLYPVTSETSTVVFITDGPEIATQSSPNASFIPTKPDESEMIRSGYTFKYWSKTPGGEQYDFTTPLEGTAYLYAVWTPAPVGYIINFWNESPSFGVGDPGTNTANYDLVYTRVISTAVAADKPLLGLSGKALNDEKTQIINSTIISKETNYSGGGETVINLLNYSMFGWTDADKKPLSGNGDTVINVYAKRISYVFPFYLTVNDGNAKTASFLELNDGTRYENVDTYTVTAKLDQDISETWPISSGLVTPKENTFFLNWSGYYGNGAQVLSRGAIQELMTDDFRKTTRPAYAGDSLIQAGKYPLKPKYGALTTYELRYYYVEMSQAEIAAAKADGSIGQAIRSTLDSQKKDPTTDPHAILVHFDGIKDSYYKYHSNGNLNSQNSWNPTGWPGKDIPGFLTINTAALANKYQVSLFNAKQVDGGKWSSICYFMPRLSYGLNLITGEGLIDDAIAKGFTKNSTGTGYTKISVTFGDAIALPSDPHKDRFTFVGWYLDDKFKDKYDPKTIGTMPGNTLTLYARYEGTDIKVNYFDNDKKTVIATGSYSDGGKLSAEDLKGTEYYGIESPDSIEGKGTFRCWYYEVSPGVIGIANWGMIINSANGGVYNLYPDFASENYQVVFMTQDSEGEYTVVHNTITFKSGSRNMLSQLGYTEPSINTAIQEGYTFIEWNKKADGSGASFTTGSPIKEKTTVVYAQFKENLTVEGAIDNGTVKYSSQKGQITDSTTQNLLRGAASQEMLFTATPGYGIDEVKIYIDGEENKELSDEAASNIAENRRTFTFDSLSDVQANWEVVVSASIKISVPVLYEVKTFSAEGNPIDEVGGAVSSTEEWLNPDTGVAVGSEASVARGYIFTGWSTDSSAVFATDSVLVPTMPEAGWGEGIIYYANFTKKPVYTVSFESNGGTPIEAQQVISGELVSLPQPNPTKTGNVFASWYADKDLTQVFDFDTPIEANITLYADWSFDPVTVVFDGNGATVEADPAQMTTGRDAALGALPQDPERDHNTFLGWTEGKEGGTSFNQLTVISYDMTVYAQWEIVKYAVSFDTDGGTAVPSQTVAYGDRASTPSTPTVKSNYEFGGWYTDSSFMQAFDFDAPIFADTVVYAKWTPIYSVSFDTQGGSAVLSQRILSGEKATMPADPTRNGSTFEGWFVAADGETAFDFDASISEDTIVYAHWTLVEEPAAVIPAGPTTPETPTTPDGGSPSIIPDNQQSNGESQNIAGGTGKEDTLISDGAVPLGGLNNTGVWSLLSLVIGIFSIIVDIILVGMMILSRKKEDGSRENKEATSEFKDEGIKTSRRRRWALVVAIVIGALPIVLFFVLNNMSLPVAWVNQWTPLILMIAIVHVLIAFFATRKKKGSEEEKDAGGTFATTQANT